MTRSTPDSLAIFVIDSQSFALDVENVERVVRAVEITPLPGAPRGVRGVVNLHGAVIPVFDLHTRFGWGERDLRATDLLVFVNTARRKVALLVDSAVGVAPADSAPVVAIEAILPGFDAIEGVVKFGNEIVVIHDLERFLSIDDEHKLAEAMLG